MLLSRAMAHEQAIECRNPVEPAGLFADAIGSQQVARFRMGFSNPKIDPAPLEFPMQGCQKGCPGNVDVGRI